MAQTTSIRRRRSWPGILIVLLIVLAGLWGGAWYYGSGVLERTIDGWKAREARAGRVYTCATQTIGGFPFGLELRCADAAAEFKSNRPPLALKAKDILVSAHVWQPTVLTVQQEHGVALLFAENRDQHIGDANFLLATRLYVEYRTLQHALETQRRLHFALLAFFQARRGLIDVFLELLLQLAQISTAGAQNLAHFRGVQDREQQVLDSQILVTCLTRLVKGIVETIFKLVGQHDSNL